MFGFHPLFGCVWPRLPLLSTRERLCNSHAHALVDKLKEASRQAPPGRPMDGGTLFGLIQAEMRCLAGEVETLAKRGHGG